MKNVINSCEQSDEQLAAQAAREGSDGPAFVALLERYRQRVWAVCFRLMGNAEDTNDAAQEVFVRLFFSRAKFRGHSKYSTWVHGVALRTCLELRRSRARRRRREDEARQQAMQSTRDGHANNAAQTTLDAEQILNTLDEEDRAMLILKYAQGHSFDELAKMFTMTTSACKMRVSRAREKLKQRFPDHEFGGETE